MEQILNPRSDLANAELMPFAGKSAVSWPAIVAGAFVAAAVSLILLALGSGLGFASMSPWPGHGISSTTFAITTAIWLIVTQWLSAGVGGYMAGRLRTKWTGTHTHEVFFRDTAHGFVTWAVATVILAAVVATSLFSTAGNAAHAVTTNAPGAMQGMMQMDTAAPNLYSVDKLLRTSTSVSAAANHDLKTEITHIATNAVRSGRLPDTDRTYLVEIVASYAGISQSDAQKRVDDFITTAQAAEVTVKAEADTARKTAAEAAIYTALSMLMGAFIASVAAALGGRLRDEHI